MIYLNIKTTDLRRPEMIGSEPTERATWLFLCAYCVEQENGGTIEDCKKWKSRQWQQTCGVTKEEAETDSDLWSWDGDDLSVTFYPKDKQAEVQAKREAGKRGGKASAKARSKQSTSKAQAEGTSKEQATLEAELEASSEAELEAELERKGKERKGIGKEEEKERERKDRAGSLKELSDFCLSLDLITEDAEYLWDHWEANDWKIKNKAIRDWKATVRNWKRQGYLPSQKNPDLRATSTSNKAPPYAHREMDINGSVMIGSEKDGWTIRWGQLINFMHGTEWPAGEPDEETKERYRKMTGREPNMKPFPGIK